jgi:hypothetical protein
VAASSLQRADNTNSSQESLTSSGSESPASSSIRMLSITRTLLAVLRGALETKVGWVLLTHIAPFSQRVSLSTRLPASAERWRLSLRRERGTAQCRRYFRVNLLAERSIRSLSLYLDDPAVLMIPLPLYLSALAFRILISRGNTDILVRYSVSTLVTI